MAAAGRRPKGADGAQRRYDGGTPLVRIPWLHLGSRLDPEEPEYGAIDLICRTRGTFVAELGQPWSGRLADLDPGRGRADDPAGRAARITSAVRWTTDTAWIDDETWIHLLTGPERDEILRVSLGPVIERIERYYAAGGRSAALAPDNPLRDLLARGRARTRGRGTRIAPSKVTASEWRPIRHQPYGTWRRR